MLVDQFPAAWLRASCPCPACRDPRSGQRLAGITGQPPAVSIGSVTENATTVLVRFEPDGHEAVFSKSWLAGCLEPVADQRTEEAKRLWAADAYPDGPPAVRWEDYRAERDSLAGCLSSLLAEGFFLIKGVPALPGKVLEVASSFGFVRETNDGRVFDVAVNADPANLACSVLAVAPHTDNPYRDPVPTVRLLHCLASAAGGGLSSLADGFAAARLLRNVDRAAFDLLACTPVMFRHADENAELTATLPVIGLDRRRRIREIRCDERSMQPLRPGWRTAPGGFAAQAEAFYEAYRNFAGILIRPDMTLTFVLEPGDCLVLDNTRILHGRAASTAAGHRHLQGCYADLDGAESTLAVLRRQHAWRDEAPALIAALSERHGTPPLRSSEL